MSIQRLALPLLTVFVGLAPALARADEAPERLLPATTQVYLRWDGVEAHRAGYEKTAFGKMLQEDTGKFLAGVYADVKGSLGTLLTVPRLLGGAPPEKLQKIQADVAEAEKILPFIVDHGFVVAAELRGVEPPAGQVVVVFPGAGAKPEPFLAALRLAVGLADGVEVKEEKTGNIEVFSIEHEPSRIVWWIDGKDAVLAVTSDKAVDFVKSIQKGPRLAEHPEFKKLQAFKEFETAGRSFIDAAALAKTARTVNKETAKALDELGLDGLKSIRIFSGFDGPADLGLVEIDAPGPRKGVLRLLDQQTFKLADLPPLPSDMISVTASRFNYATAYDVVKDAVVGVTTAIDPEKAAAVKGVFGQEALLIGVDIRNDLLASLGDLVVLSSSPAEGPFSLGQSLLIQVKDEKKFTRSIEQLVKSVSTLTGADVRIKKRMYHGAEIHELHVKAQGFVFLPTFTTYKGWLAVGYYPQAVQGYVLRANGEVPVWKPGKEVEAGLAKLPGEFTSLSISDPRPSIVQILTVTPFIGRTVLSFVPDGKFDVGAVPNGHEATRHLFPNVAVGTDDGNTVRWHSRSSIRLPVDISGLDGYFGIVFLAFLGRIA